jgi:hypothetical protein
MQSVDSAHQRKEQWVFVGEVWLTIIVTVALLPVLIDLWAYTFTEIGAKMEHWAYRSDKTDYVNSPDLGESPLSRHI